MNIFTITYNIFFENLTFPGQKESWGDSFNYGFSFETMQLPRSPVGRFRKKGPPRQTLLMLAQHHGYLLSFSEGSLPYPRKPVQVEKTCIHAGSSAVSEKLQLIRGMLPQKHWTHQFHYPHALMIHISNTTPLWVSGNLFGWWKSIIILTKMVSKKKRLPNFEDPLPWPLEAPRSLEPWVGWISEPLHLTIYWKINI